MKMNRVPRGRRGMLTLLMVAALAFGQVPAGAFAFAATQTGSSAAAGATADTLDAQDFAIEYEQEAGQAAGADGGTEEEEPNGRQDGPENEAQGTQDPEAEIRDQLEPAQDPTTMIVVDSVEPDSGLTREVAGLSITTMAKAPTAPVTAPATYTVTVNGSTNGSVNADKATAAEGETVTLTVTPDTNYSLKSLAVTDASGNPVTVTSGSFTMPASNVTVTATFNFVPIIESPLVKQSTIYAGEISVDGTPQLSYLYSPNITVTATVFANLKKALAGTTVQGLVPTIAYSSGAAPVGFFRYTGSPETGTVYTADTDYSGGINEDWSSATAVAGRCFTGIVGTETAGSLAMTAGSPIDSTDGVYITGTLFDDGVYYSTLRVRAGEPRWVEVGGILVKKNVMLLETEGTTVVYTTVNVSTPYTVTVNTPTNGSVSADKTSAAAGDTVTLTVTPDSHYELDTLSVTDASNNPVTVNADNTFTMPASNVTVTATFKACMHENGETVAEVPATCTDGGVRAYWRCSSCGKLFTDETHATETTLDELRIPALGHDWGEGTVTTEPTCTDAGERTFTCSHDATHTKTEAIDALGHDWGSWTVTTAPTCTEAGSEKRVCGHDASHTETREVAALGHDWGPWTVTKEATEAEDGEEVRVCANDPAHTEARVIPHLVVEYRNTEGDGASWTKGSGEALTFVFKRNINDNATFSHFTGIQVDGADVDAVNYTAEAGSVVVTLNAGFLEGLSEGSHTVTALFDDGNSASAGFTVKAAAVKPADDSGADDSVAGTSTKPASPTPTAGSATRTGLPGTGDSMRAIPGLMAAMALCGLAMLFAAIRLRPVRPHGKHARR